MGQNENYRNLLVTGGAGFVGSNFIRFVLNVDANVRVTNLDALTYSGNLQNLDGLDQMGRYRFVKGDIRDPNTVGPLVNESDAVIHFAAESHVDRSIADSSTFVTTNVLGTQVLLEACRTASPDSGRRMIYIGTDEVYGSLPIDRKDLLFTEDSPISPNSPYAASKAGGELLARSYHQTYGTDVIITRCSNNFGPYQFPEKVIPLFVTNLIQDRPVPLYGDGENVRDWIHVDDHCEAILKILTFGSAGNIYNIGGRNQCSNLELTRLILQLLGKGEEMIEHVVDRLGHDMRYAIDASKIESELGWTPSRSEWPGALKKTIEWYIENQKWWINLIKKH